MFVTDSILFKILRQLVHCVKVLADKIIYALKLLNLALDPALPVILCLLRGSLIGPQNEFLAFFQSIFITV